MNLDCSCDYQSQSCKAYCQLLQPVGSSSDVSCFHQTHRRSLRNGDPLRQLNTCCYHGCESLPCGPNRRNRCKTDHQKPSYPIMDYPPLAANRRLPSSHRFQHEWHSLSLEEPLDYRMNRDSWNRESLTLEEEVRYSTALRQKFAEEMSELKAKLEALKKGVPYDGKRMRQRSESEPGYAACGERVHKRARDHSPQRKRAHRKLPNYPNRCCPRELSPRRHFQRETRSVPPTMARLRGCVQEPKEVRFKESEEEIDKYSDNEGSLCAEETFASFDEVNGNGSEDDDYSLQSGVTSASTDSSTPSRVGESLRSISLSEGTVPCLSVTTTPHTSLFRSSLFSNVPPFVKFSSHDTKGPALPSAITKLLKWKLSSITPIVIRRTLVNSGFKLVRKSNDWTGQWGKHMNSFVFKTLKDFQKLNHFPGTFHIGRKDRLWKNLNRLMNKFGKKEFGFLPTTYILPQDMKTLRTAWEKSSGKGRWILKPPAAARGTGIKVVSKWQDIPKNRAVIVQKYIARPYLINGSKFDLRLYVLMTSIHPLRVYLYDDGLVRFASVKYSENMESLGDRFMHLTNYSINKLSSHYCANEDETSCQGHKWTLKTLWMYLEKEGVNVKALKKSVTDLVIKTIISGESHIQVLSKNNLPSRYCSYELFGVDVLLDANLRPWLLEVNISPSLHSASPLDLAVKGPLVRELFNIAGFQVPAKLTSEQEASYLEASGLTGKTHSLCYDKRIYTMAVSREERTKQASYCLLSREDYLPTILHDLTADDVKHLIQFEDELTQVNRFEKIFPTPFTHKYHHYFDAPRYYNMMLDAWETKYHSNREEGRFVLEELCRQNVHLQVPFPGSKAKCSQSPSDNSVLTEDVAATAESASDEAEEQNSDKPNAENGKAPTRKRSKAGVLARPTLRAILAPRRPKHRLSPDCIDKAVNTEALPSIIQQKPSLFQTCKIETSSPPPQLPPLNIRTSS